MADMPGTRPLWAGPALSGAWWGTDDVARRRAISLAAGAGSVAARAYLASGGPTDAAPATRHPAAGDLPPFPEPPELRRLRELYERKRYESGLNGPGLWWFRRLYPVDALVDVSTDMCDDRDRAATARDLAEWAAAEAARAQREQDETLRWAGSVATFAELERRGAGSAEGDRLFIDLMTGRWKP